MANVDGAAICSHEEIGCGTYFSGNKYVTGAAIYAHEEIGCGTYFSGNKYVTGAAIYAHDQTSCPFTLNLTPNATVELADTDLVYSVWSTNGHLLTLDDATVEWVASDSDGNPLITKSTDDYSIITFGSTLVVHLRADELVPDESLFYTATITTSDDSIYTMTGWLAVSGSVIDTCFMRDVTITSRSITTIHAKRSSATKVLTERAASTVVAEQRIPLIPIIERTPKEIIVLPCGKRGHT